MSILPGRRPTRHGNPHPLFKNTYTLTRHVHAQHLRHIPPRSPIPCRHPHYQVVTHECKDVDQFKVHALQVHNIAHGA